MTAMAYVNGAYGPLSEAKISVLDRGFLFADGIYEVTSVLDGRLVDNAGHLARLHRSLGELDMDAPVSDAELTTIQKRLIEAATLDEGGVYLQITRGADDHRDFPFPAQTAPSLVLFTFEKSLSNSPLAESGARVVTVPDMRWPRRDIKSVALLPQVLAKQAAAAAGAHEAWMHEDGLVTEGSSSTAFIITTDGAIVTRPLSNAILPGVTRRAVLKLAADHGLDLQERPFTVEEAYEAAEAFITSATTFVTPVVRIDERILSNGAPGPVARHMRSLYLEFARKSADSTNS